MEEENDCLMEDAFCICRSEDIVTDIVRMKRELSEGKPQDLHWVMENCCIQRKIKWTYACFSHSYTSSL